MPVMRQAVGERRAVVEDVLGRVVAARNAGAERVVAVPEVQDVGFQRREVRRSAGRLGIGAHCVRHLLCPGSPQARGRRRAGARAPRYHPACALCVRRSTSGDDGPTRSVLLGCASCSSEGSPVMAGSVPLTTILMTAASQNGGGSSWAMIRAVLSACRSAMRVWRSWRFCRRSAATRLARFCARVRRAFGHHRRALPARFHRRGGFGCGHSAGGLTQAGKQQRAAGGGDISVPGRRGPDDTGAVGQLLVVPAPERLDQMMEAIMRRTFQSEAVRQPLL